MPLRPRNRCDVYKFTKNTLFPEENIPGKSLRDPVSLSNVAAPNRSARRTVRRPTPRDATRKIHVPRPKIAESGPQGVADRLAALVEGRLDHLHEQPFIAVETLHAVAAQADDGALDLRRRIENALADGKQVFYIVKACKRHSGYRTLSIPAARRYVPPPRAAPCRPLRESGHGIRAPGKIFAKEIL